MISLPINEVKDTNIFVALNDDRTQQLTIYSNLVDNQTNSNAMVIPIPNPESVQLHDMSANKNFFSDCDKSFVLRNLSRGFKSKNLSTNSYNMSDNFSLEVKTVGSYKVSIGMNLQELENVDTNIFILSDELKNILSMHYGNDKGNWGFIVFVLDIDRKEYHPFAFSHDVLNNQIYIPTRHYHAHSVADPNTSIFDDRLGFMKYDASNIDQSPMFSSGIGIVSKPKSLNSHNLNKLNSMKNMGINILDQTMADDWSHKIYLFNINNTTMENAKTIHQLMNKNYMYEWDNTTKFNKNSFNNFQMNNNISFTKVDISGLHPNNDILIDIKA